MNDLINDLQDDFYAEADEHLTGIRRDLLALESTLNRPGENPALLDTLFRHFHTLKGLAGMVGLRDAEQLSHRMESYLRALKQGTAALTPDGLEALINGTHMLETLIGASRAKSPLPDIAPALAQLDRAAPLEAAPPAPPQASSAPNAALNAEEAARLDGLLKQGMQSYRVTFTPSQALADRGVNVNVIRARLQEMGELIHAAPRIAPGGAISFDFNIATRAQPADFEILRADGVIVAPFTPDTTVARAASTGESVPEPATRAAFSVAPSNVVRVDLARLDDLMHMLGDLIITRARLQDNLSRIEASIPSQSWRALQEVNTAFEHQLRDLREGIMRIRLVQVGLVFERMQFVVRDLAREYDKDIRLQLIGGETEIDKLIVERIMDPVLHLVRNAISHGIEPRAERLAAGKPAEATITLNAATVGDTVHVQVQDDGRGIDIERVAQRARELNILGPHDELDMLSLVDILSLPGFSTREQADRASGRGIGMSVVKNVVAELGGTIMLETHPGQGTCFTLEVPLTLAIVDALVVRVGSQTFAVPLPTVREVMELSPDAITPLENNEIIQYRGGVLPLIRLEHLFRIGDTSAKRWHALVVGSGQHAVGIVVDRIMAQREIVVHALADPLVQVPGISGATELGDGRVVLIADTTALVRLAQRTRSEPSSRHNGAGIQSV